MVGGRFLCERRAGRITDSVGGFSHEVLALTRFLSTAAVTAAAPAAALVVAARLSSQAAVKTHD